MEYIVTTSDPIGDENCVYSVFGRETPYYTTYLFAGNLFFNFFKESTKGGMNALYSNASIITKIRVPKYLFLLSQNVSSIINFGITLVVFFLLLRSIILHLRGR